MKKEELKKLIQESINEVHEEQNINQVLREDLEHDAQMLHEQRELCNELISEGILSESDLEEGFFDTVKNLGKNTFGAVANAWKKAKAQGDEDEAKRLEKRLRQLRGGAKAGGNVAKTPLQPGDHGYTAAYAKARGGKVADTSGIGKATKPAPAVSDADKKKVAVKAAKEIVQKMKKDDPEGFAKIQQLAKNPKALEKIAANPKIKQVGQDAKRKIAKAPKKGLLYKVEDWMEKNPVKATLAVGTIGALAGALAIPGITVGGLITVAMAGIGGQTLGSRVANAVGDMANKKMKKESVDQVDEELNDKIHEINERTSS